MRTMMRWAIAGCAAALCVCTARAGEIASDRKAITRQKAEIKGNAGEAHGEEAALKEQIRAAVESGDMETANDLRAQLRAAHRGNVSEMKSDKAELGAARRELKRDLGARRHGRPGRR